MSLITFRASRMNFLDLTQPSSHANGEPAYQIAVPVADLPLEITNNIPHAVDAASRSSWGLYTLRSNRKPRIMGMAPESADLKDLRDYCDWTNTAIETLLRDQPAEIACTLFEKTRPGSKDAYGVSLTAIRIDAKAVPRPSWDDLLSGKVPL